MDENEEQTLDSEYKRYLEIMRPYLGQLLDEDVIEICNAWIRRLSDCQQNEKVLRNKYIFSMCYQLAKGILEEPFLRKPTSQDLAPLQEGTNTDNSINESSEVEYLVLDLDSTKTKVIFDNDNNNPAPIEMTPSSECCETDQNKDFHVDNKVSDTYAPSKHNKKSDLNDKETILCYNNYPNVLPKYQKIGFCNENYCNDNYEYRATNLIMKLREIKKQNVMLHNELMVLREEAKLRNEHFEGPEYVNANKVDNAASAHIQVPDSTTTLNSLKSKLQEVQDARKMLIETVSELQDKLDNFEDMKKHEIEDLNAGHRLEIIKIKTSVREETKTQYEKVLQELKVKNEDFIKDLESKHLKEVEKVSSDREAKLAEKDKIIQSLEAEMNELKNYIEGLKNNQYYMFSNFLDRSPNDLNSKCMTQKAEELERRLNKMEKSKIRISKTYEAKLAHLQKEKQLVECSLQLQLAKQRAQIINETADEHQMELAGALDNLEGKYKDIVASVQATAVQRRIQDQVALESLIQTVCGIRSEGLQCSNAQANTYAGQLSNKAMRNQTRDPNQARDTGLPTVTRDHKVGSVIVGKALMSENGYCLDGENLSELFDAVCVPQRDTGESSPKK